MDKLQIKGPCKLNGEITVSQSKNSCLPLLCATLLVRDEIRFEGLPNLRDIQTLKRLLVGLGCVVSEEGTTTKIDTSGVNKFEADYELVKTMRASILVLGPLLARYGKSRVSLPGGCAIGSRPIDMHLKGLEKLGAEIKLENGYVEATAEKLRGALIALPFPSVGATEHLMMTAALAEGQTTIENAAREPEISDLAQFLRKMGAKVEGDGTPEVKIWGGELKANFDYKPIPDRIEAATYVIAGLITGSEIKVNNVISKHLESVFSVLEEAGAKLEINDDSVRVLPGPDLKGFKIDTAPYPGFPTDVQAQMMALAAVSNGPSVITEHIFENRFMHVPELTRMGAKITLKGSSAFIEGVEALTAAPVMCTDLRASAALVLCALKAKGESEIRRVYHLERGYENLDKKLGALGAQIEKVSS